MRPRILSSYEGKIRRILVLQNAIDGWDNKFDFPEELLPLAKSLALEHHSEKILIELLIQLNSNVLPEFVNDQDREKDPDFNSNSPYEYYYPNVFKEKTFDEDGIKFEFRFLLCNLDMNLLISEVPCSEKELFQKTGELNLWIRDPFIVLQGHHDQVVLLESFYDWNGPNHDRSSFLSRYIPEMLCSQTEVMIKSFPFYLQGGNILIGSDFAIIGGDIFQKNFKKFAGTFSTENHYRFSKAFGASIGKKEIFWFDEDGRDGDVISRPEELFHLDLFLTLGGKQPEETELVFVGELYQSSKGEWVSSKDTSLDVKAGRISKFLDAYASRLERSEKKKFRVVRLPLLFHNHKIYSYNNCLIEIFGSPQVKRAILPIFAWPDVDDNVIVPDGERRLSFSEMDDRAKRIFESQNFQVVQIDMGFRLHAENHGGLHCITQVLSRSKE